MTVCFTDTTAGIEAPLASKEEYEVPSLERLGISEDALTEDQKQVITMLKLIKQIASLLKTAKSRGKENQDMEIDEAGIPSHPIS